MRSRTRPTWDEINRVLCDLVEEGVLRSFDLAQIANGRIQIAAKVDQGAELAVAEERIRRPLETVMHSSQFNIALRKGRV